MKVRWTTVLALVVVGALSLWIWPYVRPAFTGGVRAAAGLLDRTGPWGPLVIIALQALQSIISPLPSWPIIVSAGALYGPLLATLYNLVGALVGAVINFMLARRFATPLIRSQLGEAWVERAGRLTAVHFLGLSLLGRALPFASFDLVAYLAGVSKLSLPIFLMVAAFGQAPAIFAYAYLGKDLAIAQRTSLWSSVLLFGVVVVVYLAQKYWDRIQAK